MVCLLTLALWQSSCSCLRKTASKKTQQLGHTLHVFQQWSYIESEPRRRKAVHETHAQDGTIKSLRKAKIWHLLPQSLPSTFKKDVGSRTMERHEQLLFIHGKWYIKITSVKTLLLAPNQDNAFQYCSSVMFQQTLNSVLEIPVIKYKQPPRKDDKQSPQLPNLEKRTFYKAKYFYLIRGHIYCDLIVYVPGWYFPLSHGLRDH